MRHERDRGRDRQRLHAASEASTTPAGREIISGHFRISASRRTVSLRQRATAGARAAARRRARPCAAARTAGRRSRRGRAPPTAPGPRSPAATPALATRPAAPDPQRVEPGEQPRLGPQQPGQPEQPPDGAAAPRPLDLEHHRPRDQRAVRDVEEADRGQQPEVEARRSSAAATNPPSTPRHELPEPVHRATSATNDGDAERDEQPRPGRRAARAASAIGSSSGCSVGAR